MPHLYSMSSTITSGRFAGRTYQQVFDEQLDDEWLLSLIEGGVLEAYSFIESELKHCVYVNNVYLGVIINDIDQYTEP